MFKKKQNPIGIQLQNHSNSYYCPECEEVVRLDSNFCHNCACVFDWKKTFWFELSALERYINTVKFLVEDIKEKRKEEIPEDLLKRVKEFEDVLEYIEKKKGGE